MHPEDSWFWKRLRNWLRKLRKIGFIPAVLLIFFSGCSPQLPGTHEEQAKIYRDIMGQVEKFTDAAMIAAKAYEKQVNKI